MLLLLLMAALSIKTRRHFFLFRAFSEELYQYIQIESNTYTYPPPPPPQHTHTQTGGIESRELTLQTLNKTFHKLPINSIDFMAFSFLKTKMNYVLAHRGPVD
jgi:hypothetical protein